MVDMRVYKVFGAVFLLGVFIFTGCARTTDNSDVVATVNGKPIYLREVKRELSNIVRQNPSLEIDNKAVDTLIDTLVKKQLIIQEAMEKKMAKEQGFIDTIKGFWEQTLIRNFVDYKNREFERYVFVTDKEIDTFYEEVKDTNENIPPLEEIRERIKEIIQNKKMSQAFEDWLENSKKKAKIRIHKNMLSEAVK